MADRNDIHYAGPTGREKPGEHWNARIIREEAEAARVTLADKLGEAARPEGSQSTHDIQTNGTGYYWCSCSPNHARDFAGLREHIADVTAPRPVIDREALDRRLETAKGHSWSIETTVDAVMELARPMPTREQIKEHLSLHWAFATDEEADEMTNAVVSLFGRSES